jgi:hypothetical protein
MNPLSIEGTICAASVPPIIMIRKQDSSEVLRIDNEGRIFWKQREVETDDDFRSAMLELKDVLIRGMNR